MPKYTTNYLKIPSIKPQNKACCFLIRPNPYEFDVSTNVLIACNKFRKTTKMGYENPGFLALGINCDPRTPIISNLNFSKDSLTLIWSTHGVYDFHPFLPTVPFSSPWKHQKTKGFLMFSGASKRNIGKKRIKGNIGKKRVK